MIQLYIAVLCVLVIVLPSTAVAFCTGCSSMGVRYGVEERPDYILLIGDPQPNDFCDRWVGFETECEDMIFTRMDETVAQALVLSGGTHFDLSVMLGDLIESNGVAYFPQRRNMRNWILAQPAWFQSILMDTMGNHDVNTSDCNGFPLYLNDHLLNSELGAEVHRDPHWSRKLKHSRVISIPASVIGRYTGLKCMEIAGACYGGTTDSGDACPGGDGDCEYRCFDGERLYTEGMDFLYREYATRATHAREILGLTVAHQAICRDGPAVACGDTGSFNAIQNLFQCDPPDVNVPCDANVDCPISASCATDRVGFKARDDILSWLTDRPGIEAWGSGHVGGATPRTAPDVGNMNLGTTSLWSLETAGPIHAADPARYSGILLVVDPLGSHVSHFIQNPSVPPVITTLADQVATASTPKDVLLAATDADYSSLYWSMVASDGCIVWSPDAPFSGTAYNTDDATVDSITAKLRVDCAAATYTVDATVSDGVVANDQVLNMTIVVSP